MRGKTDRVDIMFNAILKELDSAVWAMAIEYQHAWLTSCSNNSISIPKLDRSLRAGTYFPFVYLLKFLASHSNPSTLSALFRANRGIRGWPAIARLSTDGLGPRLAQNSPPSFWPCKGSLLLSFVRGQRWIQAIYGWPACHFSTSTDGPCHPWILPLLACIKATSLVQLN